ncbi:MAG: hydantoinase B/oxoprolinase family protein [Planctomycetota bacterium]
MDPVLLRVYQNLLDSVAEEMGSALERTSFSPNIKERRDYSCAVFDGDGEMIAQAAHNPVHLGSTPLSVEAAIAAHDFQPGDEVLLNDPYCGGTHLPDLTVVRAVFFDDSARPLFYVANRAHHADVGGAVRGSMALFTEIYQEGLRIPPVLIRRGGEPVPEVWQLLLANMRQPEERRGDLTAQLNANRVGEMGLRRIVARGDRCELTTYCSHLKDAAERHVRQFLADVPDGAYGAKEWLDDDGVNNATIPIPIQVRIEIAGTNAIVDFAGTAPQMAGCLNTNPAVALSAVFYVLRALAGEEIPSNAGCLRPVTMRIPQGSLLDPEIPAAVAGGNVETSQRLVDVLLAAFAAALPTAIPAQSQGTMNNLTLGAAGPNHSGFSYYETTGGGTGAGPWGAGASAVHSHMTNTRNTPIEMLEHAYPLRVHEYAIRRGSGGRGKHCGGEGIIREVEALQPMEAALLTERRLRAPAGAGGGGAAWTGRNERRRRQQYESLPAKWVGRLEKGDRIRLQTPGGGGWGTAPPATDTDPPKTEA